MSYTNLFGQQPGMQPGMQPGYQPSNGYWNQQQPNFPRFGNNLMTQQPMGSGNIQFVLDEEEAKAYYVPAGQTAVLWDSKNPFIYIKTVDASGMPNLRKLRWEEVMPGEPAQPSGEQFVPFKQFEELRSQVSDLSTRIDALSKTEGGNAQ